MPDPVRKQIMDKVISALSSISTAVSCVTPSVTVSESIRHPEELDKKDFPWIFPIDTDETKEPWALYGGAGPDMHSTLTVLVTSMVYDRKDSTRTARCNLIRDVEMILVTSAGIAGVTGVLGVEPTRVVTDKGNVPNYSLWDQEFKVEYIYESDDGG